MKSVLKTVGAAVLAAVAAGFAAAALDGTITAPSGTKITVTAGAPAVRVELPDGTAFDVPAAMEGDTLTFSAVADDPTCPGEVGVYTVAETETEVTFTLVSDDCEARQTDLTAGAWTKAAE